jgi:hypothetical protein
MTIPRIAATAFGFACCATVLFGALGGSAWGDSCANWNCPAFDYCDISGCHYCVKQYGESGGNLGGTATYAPIACGNGAVNYHVSQIFTYPTHVHLTVYDASQTDVYQTPDIGPGDWSTGPLGWEPRTVLFHAQAYRDIYVDTYDAFICLDGNQCCGVNCDDGNPCTNDSCDPLSGCHHANNTNPCADDGNPCTQDRCNTGRCYRTAPMNGAACDDGNACTSGDHCQSGSCVGSTISCDDGNVCTADGCNPSTGCWHSGLSTGACDDGNACTVGDHCQGGTCVGTGISCDDGNPCTSDGCTPSSGCVHGPLLGSCSGPCDTSVCTIVSSTYPWATCQPVLVCGDHAVRLGFPYFDTGDIAQNPSGGALSADTGSAAALYNWRIIKVANGPASNQAYVAIQSLYDNKYWTVATGGITASATVVGASETFLYTRTGIGTQFGLSAPNGQVVGTDGFGPTTVHPISSVFAAACQ